MPQKLDQEGQKTVAYTQSHRDLSLTLGSIMNPALGTTAKNWIMPSIAAFLARGMASSAWSVEFPDFAAIVFKVESTLAYYEVKIKSIQAGKKYVSIA